MTSHRRITPVALVVSLILPAIFSTAAAGFTPGAPVMAAAAATRTPTRRAPSPTVVYPPPTPYVSESATVVSVKDGDTIVVRLNGKEVQVRYIGVDSPEGKLLGSDAATRLNKSLVDGKTVRLERDKSETDRYDRLLRYVWVKDLMVNSEMVRLGQAVAKAYPPDTRHRALFEQLQAEAQAGRRGGWSPGGAFVAGSAGKAATATPAGRGAALSTPAPGAACPQGCQTPPKGCVIKGNISTNNGKKIYHIPGCQYYEQTKIEPAQGERWFCTEAEAAANGWNKAGNCP